MTLKLYFSGSIRGGRQDAALYARTIEKLQAYGKVLTEYVGQDDAIEKEVTSGISDKSIHDREVECLKQCDALIAEVTQPSLGVGYEIGRAVTMKKPILCLYRPSPGRTLSAMLTGAHNGETFVVREYSEPEMDDILKQFIKSVSS